MTLGDRISLIIQEGGITQIAFAKSLGKSINYINQIANGKKPAISETLAMLIQELYGYSAHWILTGEGEKMAVPPTTQLKAELTKRISVMSEDEVVAALAFAQSLESVKAALKIKTE